MRKRGNGINKTYVIAEIGINHNGSLDNCYKLIEVAAEAGCDCAKFQLFSAEKLYPRSAGRLKWSNGKKSYSYDIYSAAESCELPNGWIKPIMKRCAAKNIDFLSSVSDMWGADYLAGEGVKMLKLPSYVITNIPLIEHCARLGMSIIMSAGAATMSETDEAVRAASRDGKKLSLLHCSAKYPTELCRCNLGVIRTLQHAFPDIVIGYSDHTKEVSAAAVQAVYLGAKIIEKHITLAKDMPGPDHFFALEPHELKIMVDEIRRAESDCRSGSFKIDRIIYGNPSKKVYDHENYLRKFAFTCLFAGKDIKKGERIKAKDINILRPGNKDRGIEPKYLKLFEKYKVRAKTDIDKEDPIVWDKILG